MTEAEKEAQAVANKLLQHEAISGIVRTWGVSDSDRVEAIRIVLTGQVQPSKVVGAVEDIANALGGLEALKSEVPQLVERSN